MVGFATPKGTETRNGNTKRGHRGGPSSGKMSGGVLLSHAVSHAVPSALKGLASGFGMGPGVSPSLWPPKLYGVLSCELSTDGNSSRFPTVTREPHSGRLHTQILVVG